MYRYIYLAGHLTLLLPVSGKNGRSKKEEKERQNVMEEGCKRDFSLVWETVGTNETKLNEKKRERKRADDDEVDDIKSPRILGNIFLHRWDLLRSLIPSKSSYRWMKKNHTYL